MSFGHNVFFKLGDSSESAKDQLVQWCQEYLSGHPGTEFFSVGVRADTDREVNDCEFDVALNLVFDSRASHDLYQQAARHQQFIELTQNNWQTVRVFDYETGSA